MTWTPSWQAAQPALHRSPQHTNQPEITIRYTRPSVVCIATVLTAYTSSVTHRPGGFHTRLTRKAFGDIPGVLYFQPEAKNKIRDLSFIKTFFRHACFLTLGRPPPSRAGKLESPRRVKKEGRGQAINGSPGNNNYTTQLIRLRGAVLDWTGLDCARRRGHHQESGEGKRRFVAWSFFTVMSVRGSSSFSFWASSPISLVRRRLSQE